MEEQRFFDLGEALEDGGVGREGFALFDEGADDPSAGSGQVPTLIFTASGLLRTLAAISAPCSVKACGRTFEKLRFWRWSQFATTSAFSRSLSWKNPECFRATWPSR